MPTARGRDSTRRGDPLKPDGRERNGGGRLGRREGGEEGRRGGNRHLCDTVVLRVVRLEDWRLCNTVTIGLSPFFALPLARLIDRARSPSDSLALPRQSDFPYVCRSSSCSPRTTRSIHKQAMLPRDCHVTENDDD